MRSSLLPRLLLVAVLRLMQSPSYTVAVLTTRLTRQPHDWVSRSVLVRAVALGTVSHVRRKNPKDAEERWSTLLTDPRSSILLERLVSEALAEDSAGATEVVIGERFV